MPPFQACEEMPMGMIPPLKYNKLLLADITGKTKIKDYVDNFKREMPGELIDSLMLGIVKVDHKLK